MVQQFNNRHSVLTPFLKKILVLESDDQKARPQSFQFFADGCPGIVYQQSTHGIALNSQPDRLATVFLYGQPVKPIQLDTFGPYRIIVFFLQPHAIMPLLGIRADELTDTCIDLSLLPVSGGFSLQDQLINTNLVEKQVAILSAHLLKLIQLNRAKTDRMLDFAVGQLLESNGRLALAELQQNLNMSERTFERRFEQYVGLSPRLFSRICRFQSTLKQLQSRHYQKLSDIAFDNGYADQSHFIRTFKEFTGVAPLTFFKQTAVFAPDLSLAD